MEAPKSLSAWWSVAMLALASTLQPSSARGPHRVHLEAMENPTECVVWWMTPEETPASVVQYGTEPDLPLRAVSAVPPFTYTETRDGQDYRSEYIHIVKLTGLPAEGVEIFYRVGHYTLGWSPTKSFRTRTEQHWSTVRILTMGDQDTTGESRRVIDRILSENEQYSFVWLLGDFAYAGGKQEVWDEHADMTEPLFSRWPALIGIGNHEREYRAFDAYDIRWRHADNQANQYWFSLDEGAVHVVSLSCEHNMYPGSDQFKWLEEDLKRANHPDRRKQVPWIVAMTHKPAYTTGKSNENDPFIGLVDSLGRKYDVNLFLYGHDHHYDRSYPVYGGRPTTEHIGTLQEPYTTHHPFNMGGERLDPIHIVAGTAGRRVRECRKKKDYMAVQCINDNGYGVIEADRRQLIWTFKNTNGEVRDSFKICSRPFCVAPPRPPGAGQTGNAPEDPPASAAAGTPPPPPPSPPSAPTFSRSAELLKAPPPPPKSPPPGPPPPLQSPPAPPQPTVWSILGPHSLQPFPGVTLSSTVSSQLLAGHPSARTQATSPWDLLFNQPSAAAPQGTPSPTPPPSPASDPPPSLSPPTALLPLDLQALSQSPSPPIGTPSLPIFEAPAAEAEVEASPGAPPVARSQADPPNNDAVLEFLMSLLQSQAPQTVQPPPLSPAPPSPGWPQAAPQQPGPAPGLPAGEGEPLSMCDLCSLAVSPVCLESGIMLAPNMCIAVACLGIDPADVDEEFCPTMFP